MGGMIIPINSNNAQFQKYFKKYKVRYNFINTFKSDLSGIIDKYITPIKDEFMFKCVEFCNSLIRENGNLKGKLKPGHKKISANVININIKKIKGTNKDYSTLYNNCNCDIQCDKGYHPNKKSPYCSKCKLNNTKWDGSNCVCAEGYYCKNKKEKDCTQCMPCPVGTYKNNKSNLNEDCKYCGPGKTTTHKASTKAKDCTSCPAGKYKTKDMKTCESCPNNKSSNNNRTKCLCDKGYYCKNQYTKNCKKCVGCPKGTYKNTISNSKKDCKDCGPGKTTNKKGAKSCIPCEPGNYVGKSCRRLVGYEIKNNQYQKCGLGKISNNDTGWKCIVPRCDPGEKYGVNGCEKCKPGTSSSPTGTIRETKQTTDRKCYPCDKKKGFYQDTSGQAACKMCPGGLSTGKKCFKKREIYISGNRYLRRGNMGNVPQRKGFLCEDLDYLREYKNINSSIKCKELCWKDPKCELSLYKKYPGKSKKKPECYNKTTNYNKVEKKNGEFMVTNKRAGFRDSRKFSSICQNPSKNSNNYISDSRGIPSDNSRGWKKQGGESKIYGIIWDRLFFKPVN